MPHVNRCISRWAWSLGMVYATLLTPPGFAVELPMEVVPGIAPAWSSVTTALRAPLAGTSRDSSSLSGEGLLNVDSPLAPYGHGQVTALEVVLSDGMDLSLSLFGAGISAHAAPGATRVRMVQPGAAAEVVNDHFTQTENLFAFEGLLDLSTESEPFDLSTIEPIAADLTEIRLRREEDRLIAEVALDLEFTTDVTTPLGPIPVTIRVTGGVFARETARLLIGDTDGNGIVNLLDIDGLYAAIRDQQNGERFDVNGDGLLNQVDVDVLVREELNTFYGDSDGDGEFNSSDLVKVLQAGEYDDGVMANSRWETGDWNGDREFDSSDLILVFADGGYELGPRAVLAVQVPEPSGWLLASGFLCLWALRTRRCAAA